MGRIVQDSRGWGGRYGIAFSTMNNGGGEMEIKNKKVRTYIPGYVPLPSVNCLKSAYLLYCLEGCVT